MFMEMLLLGQGVVLRVEAQGWPSHRRSEQGSLVSTHPWRSSVGTTREFRPLHWGWPSDSIYKSIYKVMPTEEHSACWRLPNGNSHFSLLPTKTRGEIKKKGGGGIVEEEDDT